MAKEKIDIDVSGLSWEDVINLDPVHIKGLSEKSLAKLTSRLVSAYNKRAKRLEQSGIAEHSPAYRGLMEGGKTRLSVKGKSHNELVSTYADAKRLLTERKTFSLGGTRTLMRKVADRIGHEFESEEESKGFWEAIDKLKEKGIGVDKRQSTDVQKEVSDMMFNEGASVDDILRHYGIVIEAQTPDVQAETEQMFDTGLEEDDEDGQGDDGFTIEGDEW